MSVDGLNAETQKTERAYRQTVSTGKVWDYPRMIFDLHLTCNQSCSYCVAGAGRGDDFGPIIDPNALGRIKGFMQAYGPFNLILTGGEPLITPNIGELLGFLADEGHIVSMQTNLKSGAEKIFDFLSPDRTGWILATLHSVALARSDRFIHTVADLRAAGYPVVVKLVLDQVLLESLVPLYDRLLQEKIPMLLSPLIHFPAGSEAYAQSYTPAEWAVIAPRITLRSSWLYFAGGWRSQGHMCRAGATGFYARANSGEIGGCAHNFPDHMGDLYKDILRPLDNHGPCGLDLCLCDYNYYAGLPLDLDEHDRFQALLEGDMTPVSHNEYRDWMNKAGIHAVHDLTPLLKEAERISAEPACPAEKSNPASGSSIRLTAVKPDQIHRMLGFREAMSPNGFMDKPLNVWSLEDDVPVLRYLFRNLNPARHLEFGTGSGLGALACLQESRATVWTLDEPGDNGGLNDFGGLYRAEGHGHRVFQLLSDSRKWEGGSLPGGFFDSALIHQTPQKVRLISDTQKALELVRPGGLIMWRYFCPPVMNEAEPVRVAMTTLLEQWPALDAALSSIFWVDRTWLLVGIKR